MLTGENGLLTKASQAQEESKKAQYQEEIDLILAEKQIEKATNVDEKRELIELVAEGIKEKEWQESVTICDEEENDNIDPATGTTILVETKDGYEIIVKIDNEKNEGKVESITKGRRKKWKITFDINGGEGTKPEEIETAFSIAMPKGENLSRSGYEFVGWSEDKNTKENDKENIFLPRKHLQTNQRYDSLCHMVTSSQ